jgi:hypothetical protein
MDGWGRALAGTGAVGPAVPARMDPPFRPTSAVWVPNRRSRSGLIYISTVWSTMELSIATCCGTPLKPSNLVEVLRWRALRQPDRRAYVFLVLQRRIDRRRLLAPHDYKAWGL